MVAAPDAVVFERLSADEADLLLDFVVRRRGRFRRRWRRKIKDGLVVIVLGGLEGRGRAGANVRELAREVCASRRHLERDGRGSELRVVALLALRVKGEEEHQKEG